MKLSEKWINHLLLEREKSNMSKTLQKLEWENKARLLFFKHRGDISRVVKELRDEYENEVENVGERITVDFVEKVIKRFKKQQKVNDPYVAVFIMEYIFMGTKQREVQWDIDDEELGKYKFLYRSVCCDKATKVHLDETGDPHFTCMKCDKICSVYRIPNLDVFEMDRKIRNEKRRDELQLIKAVESLGFGSEKPPVFKQTNYQVITGDNPSYRKKVRSLPVGDKKLVEDVGGMDPRDRESIIKKLESARRDKIKDVQDK